MSWVGPYRLRNLLEASITSGHPWPPRSNAIYVVTEKAWSRRPGKPAVVLYVGGNTGKSKRFCTRVGDLVADMLGFYGGGTGHHSGGQTLWRHCKKTQTHPLDLFIGWQKGIRCGRCAEIRAWRLLEPSKNRVAPSRCRVCSNRSTS